MRRRIMKNRMYYMNSPNHRIHTAHIGHHKHELWVWVVAIVGILFAAFMILAAINGNYVWPLFPMYPYT